MKKIHGRPIYWMSPNENVAVTYNVFGMGSKYSIYRKRIYDLDHGGTVYWEYVTSFTFVGEAITYAKKIVDAFGSDTVEKQENSHEPKKTTHDCY